MRGLHVGSGWEVLTHAEMGLSHDATVWGGHQYSWSKSLTHAVVNKPNKPIGSPS